MKIVLKGTGRFKKACLGLSGLLLVSGLYMNAPDILDSDEVHPPKQTSQKAQKAQKAQKKKDAKQTPEQVSAQDIPKVITLDLTESPFIEISLLRKAVPDEEGNIPDVQYVPRYSANADLPAIPRPSLPPIPGNAPMPDGMAPAAASPAIAGILTSSDGQAMAIMADGSIVSEGDTYLDGRIAYIGGTGIEFDNGDTLEFK